MKTNHSIPSVTRYAFALALLCLLAFGAGCSTSVDVSHLQTPQQAGLGSGPKPGEITSTMKVYRHFGTAGAAAPSAQSAPTNIK